MNKCLKFNIDGSAFGKPGPTGCGGLLHNEMGSILALFYGPLGIMDSNVAEVMAIKVALGIFVRSVWKGVFSGYVFLILLSLIDSRIGCILFLAVVIFNRK
ncbi:hypothetical protein CRYUN_Cryun15aG0090000 [Craigia yunnanensis]